MQADSSPPSGSITIAGVASAKGLVDLSEIRNTTDLLVDRLRDAPDHIAFEVRPENGVLAGAWEQVSTSNFMSEVRGVARGLIASGIGAGDHVLIMAPTQYLWAVADFASMFAGAIVVPSYDTATDAQLDAILRDVSPVAAFAGDGATHQRIMAAAERTGQEIRVWVFGATHLSASEHALPPSMDDLQSLAPHVSEQTLEDRRRSASLDDIATIVYTSGTTGTPKGAQITHRNLVGQVLNTAAAYGEVVKDTGNTVLFLPLTHVLGRALQLICVAKGMRVAHLSDPKEVVQALTVLKPTFLVVVPRVLEKIQAAAESAARTKKIEPLWRRAVETAERWGAHLERVDAGVEQRVPVSLRAQHAVFERVFYRRLRAVMGNRIDYLLSGAATLQPSLARFFRGLGVPVIEGYGLTETTAPLAGGRPGSLRSGTVGTPLPGNIVAISSEGEVLARGVGIFAGYRRPEHNEGAFLDGYFRTGDLGSLDEDGTLTLMGRAKNVIVTSTGRTISPETWEQTAETHPLVAHAVLVGNDRPYLVGVLVLDPQALLARGHEHEPNTQSPLPASGVQLCHDESILKEVSAAVQQANEQVVPSERVQRWKAVLISPANEQNFVTPTMKLKRAPLLDALDPVVTELFH